MALSVDEAWNILTDTETDIEVRTDVPFRPKGGQIFIYEPPDAVKQNDWRADGHRWVNQGSVRLPRSNPKVVKKYFYIKKSEGGASKDFVRFAYHLEEADRFLIQYVGDESASEEFAHGNRKENRDIKKLFRTKPSMLKEWATKVEVENPNKVYKSEVVKIKDVTAEVTEKPRDLKQLQNVRHKMTSSHRLFPQFTA